MGNAHACSNQFVGGKSEGMGANLCDGCDRKSLEENIRIGALGGGGQVHYRDSIRRYLCQRDRCGRFPEGHGIGVEFWGHGPLLPHDGVRLGPLTI